MRTFAFEAHFATHADLHSHQVCTMRRYYAVAGANAWDAYKVAMDIAWDAHPSHEVTKLIHLPPP